MGKYKVSESALGVLWEGLKLYCIFFQKYSLYMLFPVFGQFIGLAWVFSMTYLFTSNADYLINEIPALNNMSAFLICLMLIACLLYTSNPILTN